MMEARSAVRMIARWPNSIHIHPSRAPSRLQCLHASPLRITQLHFSRSFSVHKQSMLPLARRPSPSVSLRLSYIHNGQSRSITIRRGSSIKENIRLLFRYHPYSMIGVTIVLLAGLYMLAWTNYYYVNYHQKMFHNYPEQVVKQLRKAWYYTEIELQPQLAMKYYAKAIDACRELRLDPYSNEVLGIKESIVYLREKCGDLPRAAKLWEQIRADVLQQTEASLSLPDLSLEDRQKRRTRLLKRAVQISVKLAETYSDPTMNNDTSAMELLMWSVTTVLRETAARNAFHATDDTHGEWLSNDQFGASLEALGHKYEAQNAHYLAAPLFLQALAAKEKTDCHSVVLMNNLAISLAQQQPPRERGMPPPDRAQLVRAGREWAEKALRVAGEITPPLRDEECDQGCATALYNLGEMAEMLEERGEARRKYHEALSLAKATGFGEGEAVAKEALARLEREDGRGH